MLYITHTQGQLVRSLGC